MTVDAEIIATAEAAVAAGRAPSVSAWVAEAMDSKQSQLNRAEEAVVLAIATATRRSPACPASSSPTTAVGTPPTTSPFLRGMALHGGRAELLCQHVDALDVAIPRHHLRSHRDHYVPVDLGVTQVRSLGHAPQQPLHRNRTDHLHGPLEVSTTLQPTRR